LASLTLLLTPYSAAEDPIKRLFIEKLKDYQKKKPANENLKRVVNTIKQSIETSSK
jgi:hypothetical protein